MEINSLDKELEKVKICGSISGNNINKYDKAGLTAKKRCY